MSVMFFALATIVAQVPCSGQSCQKPTIAVTQPNPTPVPRPSSAPVRSYPKQHKIKLDFFGKKRCR